MGGWQVAGGVAGGRRAAGCGWRAEAESWTCSCPNTTRSTFERFSMALSAPLTTAFDPCAGSALACKIGTRAVQKLARAGGSDTKMGSRAVSEGLGCRAAHRASADWLPVPVPGIKSAVLRCHIHQLLLGAVLHPRAVQLRTRGWLAIEPCTVLVGGMGSAAKDVGHWTMPTTAAVRRTRKCGFGSAGG